MYLNRNNGTARAKMVLGGAKFQFPELIEAEPWSLSIQDTFSVSLRSPELTSLHDMIFSWQNIEDFSIVSGMNSDAKQLAEQNVTDDRSKR